MKDTFNLNKIKFIPVRFGCVKTKKNLYFVCAWGM